MGATFLLGGARSGKSTLAVRIASGWHVPVTFLATGEAKDEEMAKRIAMHRAERPADWGTVEAPRHLERALADVDSRHGVVVDCVSFWVANLVMDGVAQAAIEEEARRVASVAAERAGPIVVVSNEVGLGLVPDNELGRSFRDTLGRVNAVFAARSDGTYLVVAGRVLELAAFPLEEES